MLMKEFRKFGKDTATMSKDAWKKRVAESLLRTMDDYGLWSFSGQRHKRMDKSRCPENAKQPIRQLLKVRAAALYCKMRAARWGPQISTDCDAGCESSEYLRYMIQKFPSTEGSRHKRHNNIVKILEREL